MRTWTIGKRLVAGFATVLIIVVAMGTFGVVRLFTIRADAQRVVNDSLPGTAQSGEIAAAVRDNYAHTLRYILAQSPAEEKTLDGEMAADTEQIAA
jgi:methyl-accepting chemotaxis protein